MIRERGRIYYASLPDVDDEKTVLVVSANFVNEFLQAVVVQVTSTERTRSFPTTVELVPPEGGVDRLSFVLCHEIATLEDDDIREEPLGPPIPGPKMVEVERALMVTLGIG